MRRSLFRSRAAAAVPLLLMLLLHPILGLGNVAKPGKAKVETGNITVLENSFNVAADI